MKPTYGILVLSLLLGSCESPPPQVQAFDIDALAKDYKSLRLITPKEVFVNPELAYSCIGVSRLGVEAARKKSGPHANTSVSIYMNESAAEAFQTPKSAYPVGAVVVKEKHGMGYRAEAPSGDWVIQPDGVGGMVKRGAGYDPEHGDWEYFYFEDPARVERGKIASCVGCHAGAADRDHVYGDWARERKTR